MTEKPVHKPLVDVLTGKRCLVPPVWLMRQAGRYLPEYREVRQKAGSFLKLCYSPELASEVTLQPIRRFGFDAAILFSDILVVPHAMGRSVRFVEGEGPQLDPLDDPKLFGALPDTVDHAVLAPVYETVGRVKEALSPSVALLGFCGAPWTVATYMIAGHGTTDQAPARLFAYRYPEAFTRLIDVLANASVEYLARQLQAGADAVQVFDTWAGVLPPQQFRRWCVEPMRKIVAGLRARVPDAKVIGFPRGAGMQIADYAEATGVNAIGLDWTMPLDVIETVLQPRWPVQGNLDPLVLRAGGEALDRSVDSILKALSGGPFVFNLGHGILPDTPIEHVERMLKRTRG